MIKAHGNDTVIKTLEKLLARAREGEMGYLMAVMVGAGETMAEPLVTGGWGGTPNLERICMIALEKMAGTIDGSTVNKTLPMRDVNPAFDRVCYNVPLSPLSFDFIHWLIDAEMTRRLAGAPAPLKVGFWFGRDGKVGLEHPGRRQMFKHVMQPALGLIGAVEDETAVDGACNMGFGFKKVADLARQGHEVPRFSARRDMRDLIARQYDKPPITITLREAEQWPHRNSNLEAWLRFADYLTAHGESVVFVRDTAKASMPLTSPVWPDRYATCPEASIDLDVRAALYSIARMNFFVSNGPATLAYFSDWPWMMFLKMEADGHAYEPNTPKFWREQFGIEVGEQFPWSRARSQRIVWADDSYENLVSAWETMKPARVGLETA